MKSTVPLNMFKIQLIGEVVINIALSCFVFFFVC